MHYHPETKSKVRPKKKGKKIHPAKCRVKSHLQHTLVLYMHRVLQHMHDIRVIQIRWNSVRVHPKLLVIKWLGLSVTVRVRARDKE